MSYKKSPVAASSAGRAYEGSYIINKYDYYVKQIKNKNDIKPPYYVRVIEAAALYRYMAKQIKPCMEFIDSRNVIIFDALENIYFQGGLLFMSESYLLLYLKEQKLLEEAGGESYVKTIFGGYEPEGHYVF